MSDILSGLNPTQKEAVTHTGSPLLLLAGAGSGKTRVLTHRAAWFVENGLATPGEILLLTFTNKAAGEMKERMAKLLKLDKSNYNSLFAGTFHSFCCRVLRTDGAHVGIGPNFVIYDESDQENVLKSIILNMDLTTKEFKPSSVSYFIEAAKNNNQSPAYTKEIAHGFWQEICATIYDKYQKRLLDLNALDFNDLLYKVVELFGKFPEIVDKYQQRYKYILVDEYQDTNQVQYVLTKQLARLHRQITAVGDASQAIYGWRGANFQNLISFTTDFANTKVIKLEQNYRSTQTILEAANSVIVKNTSHPVLKLFTDKKSSDKITIFEAESEVAEADYIAEKINFISANMHIPLRQIAILYRMNAQSRALEEAMLKLNIPYVLLGGTKFYERAEVKDIISMLRLVVNPKDRVADDRVTKALGKRRMSSFNGYLLKFDKTELTSLQILESIVVNSGYLDKFDLKDEEDQRRVENIKELKSVATTHPEINDFLENIALVQNEYSQQEKTKKAKDSQEGVRLMTLHSSKGLEFEVVFLVGFEEGILPHARCLVDESQIEEERRLAYVGITRAKDYLFITYAKERLYFGKSSLNEPSRFLADIPVNLIEYETSGLILRDYRKTKTRVNDDFIYDPDIY